MALQEEMEVQGLWLFKFRSVLPLILLGGGFAFYVWSEKFQLRPFDDGSTNETWFMYACMIVSFLGLALRCYIVGYTPANTSGRNTTEGQVADTINQTGMYSMVRHPLYVGNFIMWLGVALLTASIWFVLVFVLVYWVYYERIMFAEEQFLRKKFGQNYLNWANKTPAFIPSLKNYKKPALAFSWKKVLKKEKNGFTAVFLVFYLFYAAGEWIQGDMPSNNFLLYGTIISVVLYLILKMIKNNTKLLDEEGR
jgi:protein-S-isoprenylcysteine O-methyltransferase Ste14